MLNSAPVGVAEPIAVVEDTPVSVNVLTNDTDADGDGLTISAAEIDTDGDGAPEALTLGAATPITNADGDPESYSDNAAAIYVEKAEHLVIRNCVLQDSGNGLFIGSFDEASRELVYTVANSGVTGIVSIPEGTPLARAQVRIGSENLDRDESERVKRYSVVTAPYQRASMRGTIGVNY